MKTEVVRGLVTSAEPSSPRRDVLRLLGGGGVLLLANGCAADMADPGEEEVGSIEQLANTAQGVRLTYWAAFNRAATQAEVSYWVGRGYSLSKILSYHRKWMRTSDGLVDRVHVIRDAYQTVYKRLYGGGEFAYWNNYLLNNDAWFCDVCKWMEDYGRNGGFAQTGWYTIKHVYDSVTQSDASIEDYSGRTYSVPAS